MPALGRVFVQAESEVAAINMLYGAACAGARVMTSSSSPDISLMQEGLSYIAASEVPAVIVDVMRGGPGLGNSPLVRRPTNVVALNNPSVEKYEPLLATGGNMIYNASLIAHPLVRGDISALAIPASSVAMELGDGRC